MDAKTKNAPEMSAEAIGIKKVGIVGAGQMGNGIAHVVAVAGYDVAMSDLKRENYDKAIGVIQKNLTRQVSKGLIPEATAAAAMTVARARNRGRGRGRIVRSRRGSASSNAGAVPRRTRAPPSFRHRRPRGGRGAVANQTSEIALFLRSARRFSR